MSTQPGMSKASLKKKKKKFKSYFTNDSIPTSQILLLKTRQQRKNNLLEQIWLLKTTKEEELAKGRGIVNLHESAYVDKNKLLGIRLINLSDRAK